MNKNIIIIVNKLYHSSVVNVWKNQQHNFTGGQGFLFYLTKAKIPCQSIRCACFKNNIVYNSWCHNQLSCKNK